MLPYYCIQLYVFLGKSCPVIVWIWKGKLQSQAVQVPSCVKLQTDLEGLESCLPSLRGAWYRDACLLHSFLQLLLEVLWYSHLQKLPS